MLSPNAETKACGIGAVTAVIGLIGWLFHRGGFGFWEDVEAIGLAVLIGTVMGTWAGLLAAALLDGLATRIALRRQSSLRLPAREDQAPTGRRPRWARRRR